MKLTVNDDITSFIAQCMNNALYDYKNDFLGIEVTKENEVQVQTAMQEAGFGEFSGDPSTWPSLFISAETYRSSPYQSKIRLDSIQDGEFTYTKEKMPAHELFHVGSVMFDENRELNDWMMLRALDETYEAAVLWQNDEVWMLDSPSEAITIDPCAHKAKGNVLTFGLGIGYFVYMALRNPNVTSVTVIESSSAVIEMFQNYLLPQFPQGKTVQIIQGDAFAYFNQMYLDQFDYVFVDIWKSNEDGFACICNMLEQYQPPFDSMDFWIESSCFEHLPTMVLLYFNALANKLPVAHDDPFFHHTLKKVEQYFSFIDEQIDSVAQMKHFMYDRKVMREIAGTAVK